MVSTHITRVSVAVQAIAGLGLLFGPDYILPKLIPGFPATGVWFGQVLAAAMLALVALNWLNRAALIGGIYNRAVVLANTVFYFVAAMALIKIVGRTDTPASIRVLFVPIAILALVYGWMLFRGPIEKDFQAYRRSLDSSAR